MRLKLSELEERYLNRESRPEDLELISKLEKEVTDCRELVAQKEEEMKYFKLELLNREENFKIMMHSRIR